MLAQAGSGRRGSGKTGAARQRVAQLVLLLERFFSEDNGAFILINREDMAAMTGIAIETVSRMCNVAALQEISSHC